MATATEQAIQALIDAEALFASGDFDMGSDAALMALPMNRSRADLWKNEVILNQPDPEDSFTGVNYFDTYAGIRDPSIERVGPPPWYEYMGRGLDPRELSAEPVRSTGILEAHAAREFFDSPLGEVAGHIKTGPMLGGLVDQGKVSPFEAQKYSTLYGNMRPSGYKVVYGDKGTPSRVDIAEAATGVPLPDIPTSFFSPLISDIPLSTIPVARVRGIVEPDAQTPYVEQFEKFGEGYQPPLNPVQAPVYQMGDPEWQPGLGGGGTLVPRGTSIAPELSAADSYEEQISRAISTALANQTDMPGDYTQVASAELLPGMLAEVQDALGGEEAVLDPDIALMSDRVKEALKQPYGSQGELQAITDSAIGAHVGARLRETELDGLNMYQRYMVGPEYSAPSIPTQDLRDITSQVDSFARYDPGSAEELTYATVDPIQVGLNPFDPGRVTAAQENIAGRLGRGENVAQIRQAMTNPELLTEKVRGGAWGKLRDFLISPAQAKNTSIFRSPRVSLGQAEDTTFSDLLKAAQTETGDVAINRLMAKSDPRIPFSEPAGARGAFPEEEVQTPFIFEQGYVDPYRSTTALPWDTLGGPVTDQPRTNLDGTITYLTNEEVMASNVAQALANAAPSTPRPRGMPAPSTPTSQLQALAELSQTDPSIADRYALGSQALQDITTQVESFSEPTVEWTPRAPAVPDITEELVDFSALQSAREEDAQKEQDKIDRGLEHAANVRRKDEKKARLAAARDKKAEAKKIAAEDKARKTEEKRISNKQAAEEKKRRATDKQMADMLKMMNETHQAYLDRKKEEEDRRKRLGYGVGAMYT